METPDRNGYAWRLRWRGVIGIILLALTLSSCGGSDGGARAAAAQFADALGRGDTAAAQAAFGTPWDIAGFMQNRMDDYGAAQSARVEQVETNGSTATAVLIWELERATIRSVWTLEQQGDGWAVTLPSMNANDLQVTPKE
jgi:hypothetical protein